MYLTATSAAWRYSGNVTGPDSRFRRPRTIGSPLAFLGVPSASAAGAAACGSAPDVVLAAAESDELSSLPQPVAAAAASESAKSAPVHFRPVMRVPLSSVCVRALGNSHLAEVAGLQEIRAIAQLLRRPFEHQPSVVEHVRPVGDLQRAG